MWSQNKDPGGTRTTVVEQEVERKRQEEEKRRQEEERKKEEDHRLQAEKRKEEQREKEKKEEEARKQHERDLEEQRKRWWEDQQRDDREREKEKDKKLLREKQEKEILEKKKEDEIEEEARRLRRLDEEREFARKKEKEEEGEKQSAERKQKHVESFHQRVQNPVPVMERKNTSTSCVPKGGQSQRIILPFSKELQEKRCLRIRNIIEIIANDEKQDVSRLNPTSDFLPSNTPCLEETDLQNLAKIISNGKDFPLVISKMVKKDGLLNALKSLQFDITALKDLRDDRLRSKLLALLFDKHPIQKYVKEMEDDEIISLVNKIKGLPVDKKMERNRKALIRFVYHTHPSGPLFHLHKLIRQGRGLPRMDVMSIDMKALNNSFEGLTIDAIFKDFLDEEDDKSTDKSVDKDNHPNFSDGDSKQLTSQELRNINSLISSKVDFSLEISPSIAINELDEALNLLNASSKAKRKTGHNLRKQLKAALKKAHPINQFILQLTQSQVLEICKRLGVVNGNHKKDIRGLLLDRICELAPKSPIICLKNFQDSCCKDTGIDVEFSKRKIEEIQNRDDFSVILNKNTPRSEYVKFLESFDKSCAPNTTDEKLEKAVLNTLKTLHPLKGALNILEPQELINLAKMIGIDVNGKTKGVAKNMIIARIFDLHPDKPLTEYENYLLKANHGVVDEIMKTLNTDFSILSIENLSRTCTLEIMKKLELQVNEKHATRVLKDKVRVILKEQHPVTKLVKGTEYKHIYRICVGLGDVISKEHFVLASSLRKALCEYIFTTEPTSPYAYFKALFLKFLGRPDAATAMTPVFRGYPLANQANHCYVNATINGLMAVNHVRRDIHSRDNKNPLETYLSNLSFYTSEDVRNIINQNGPKFPFGEQCDAHEFLLDFVDNLQDTFITTTVRETLYCEDCQQVTTSTTQEVCPQFELSLSSTTNSMIQDLSIRDKHCTGCNDDAMHCHYVDTSIESAGNLLCFSAGRTAPNSKNAVMETSEVITLKNTKYVIRSVICHQGEHLNSGHYYTLIRHRDGSWSKVNDSVVTSGVSPQKNSYIFFYEKIDDSDNESLENLTNQMFIHNSSSPKKPKEVFSKNEKRRRSDLEKFFHGKRNAIEEQEVNIEKLKEIRLNGMAAVNSNKSNTSNISMDNPIIFEGVKMFEKMKVEFVYPRTSCKICHESSHGMQLYKDTDYCPRCFREKDQEYPTFGVKNDMVPSPIPPVLAELTFIEICAIKLACPLLHIYVRSGGKTGLKGNTIAFEQNIEEVVTILPRLPKDLPFLILESASNGNTLDFHVRPEKLLEALLWLKANNHLYKDVTISRENIDHYASNNGKVLGLRTLNQAFEPNQKKREAEEKRDEEAPLAEKDHVKESDLAGDFPYPDSLVPNIAESETLETLLHKAVDENENIQKELKETEASQQQEQPPNVENFRVPWPQRSREPLSEFGDYFYARCLPELFPDGKGGEFNRQRKGKQPSFLPWVNHLLRHEDGRFSRHAIFPMMVANQHQRRTALSLGNVIAKNSAREMTVRQLKEELEKEKSDILNQVQYYSQKIPGSNSYFYTKKSQGKAMAEHLRYRSEDTEMFNLFLTLSMADMHLKDLHELFPESTEYLNKTVVDPLEMPLDDSEAEKFITKSRDFNLRKDVINQNAYMVVNYFCSSVENLITEVLPKTIGVKDFVIRYEFQNRGAIHAHILLSCLNGPSAPELELALKTTLKSNPKFLLENAIEENADSAEIEKLIQDVTNVEDAEKAMEKLTDFAALQIGVSCLHPNPNPLQWKKPYGQNVAEPVKHACREDILDMVSTPDSVSESYENLVNTCQSHKCMMKYCLKEIKTGKKDKKKDEKIDIKDSAKEECLAKGDVKKQTSYFQCRFDFPKDPLGFNFEYETISPNGEEVLAKVERMPNILPLGSGVLEAPRVLTSAPRGNREFQTIRNHPVVNSHVPEVSFLWRGNTDCQIILSAEHAIHYLMKYMMKEEVSSKDHQKALKAAVATCNDNQPCRKGLQKILLNSTRRDISRQEGMLLLNTDRDYIKMSRPMIPCSLVGNKRLQIKNCDLDEKMAKDDGWQDKYFARETDENYQKACKEFEDDPDAWRALFPPNYKSPKSPQETSLHQFIAFLSKKWTPKKNECVPFCTPYFQFVPKSAKVERHEAYCRARLLQFKPGANPENLLFGFENHKDCLEDFVKNDKNCPLFLKEDFEKSLEAEESDDDSENGSDNEDHEFDDVGFSLDDDLSDGVTDEINLLKQLLDTRQIGDLQADGDYEEAHDEGSDYDEADVAQDIQDHDWSKSCNELNLDEQSMKDYKNWISNKKLDAVFEGEEAVDLSDVDPGSLNAKQKYAFQLLSHWIDEVQDPDKESQQMLLQIQGTLLFHLI